MSIQPDEENGGKVLTVHVSGKLEKVDYGLFVPEFERLVRTVEHAVRYARFPWLGSQRTVGGHQVAIPDWQHLHDDASE